MKIQLTNAGRIDGIEHDAGDVVEIDSVFGARLIRRGAAVRPEDGSGEPGPTRTGEKPGPERTGGSKSGKPTVKEMKAFAEEHSIELPDEKLSRDDLQKFITAAEEESE